MKEYAVVRWHLRYDETGAMEAREHPGQARRSHAEKENHDPTAKSSKSRPQKRRKQMDARDHSMVEAGIELKATETDIAALVDRHSPRSAGAKGDSEPGSHWRGSQGVEPNERRPSTMTDISC